MRIPRRQTGLVIPQYRALPLEANGSGLIELRRPVTALRQQLVGVPSQDPR